MANLGNLYYSVHLKDMTQADKDKIRKNIEKMSVSLKLNLDARNLKSSINAAIKSAGKMQIGVNKNTLKQDIRDALNKTTFKVNVKIDQAKLIGDLRKAFAAANISLPSNLAGNIAAQTRAFLDAQRALNKYISTLRQVPGAMAQSASATDNLASKSKILRSTMADVYAIYRLQRFAKHVMEIGGEFEKQKIALGSILGDTAKAEATFGQIKGLALESPFTFSELMSYTKQLSAFQIPYNDLYDTTKRLADISAGLGVDMSRLILAFGQVRSASVLRGQEVRQFTEAGIPLLDALAKKFSEVEGRAVKTSEVFEKISKRQVSFEMVKDVLWDMTDEGGQFHNMQEVLTDTLSGSLAKLRDKWQIVMGEIAEDNNGALRGMVGRLTELVGAWKAVLPVVEGAVVAYAGYKAVMAAATLVQTAQILSLRGLKAATDAHTVAQVRNLAATGNLTSGTAAILSKLGALRVAFTSLGTAGWVGLLLSAIAAVGTALYACYSNANKLDDELGEIASKHGNDARNLADGYKQLVKELGETTKGTARYNEILEQIQTRYGDYLGNIRAEADAYTYLTSQVDNVTAALRNKAMAQYQEEAMSKVTQEYAKKLSDQTNDIVRSTSKLKDITNEQRKNVANVILSDIQGGKDYSNFTALDLPSIYKRLGIGKNVSMEDSSLLTAVRRYSHTLADQAEKIAEMQENARTIINPLNEYYIQADALTKKHNDELANIPLDNMEERNRLELEYLRDLQQIYSKGGQQNKVREIEQQIAELTDTTIRWRDVASGLTKGFSFLNPDDEETFTDYIERIQKEYKELQDKINVEGRSELAAEDLADSQRAIGVVKSILEKFNQPLKEEKSSKSGSSDTWLENMKERLKLIQDAYKAYKDAIQYMSSAEANTMLNNSGAFGTIFAGGDYNGKGSYLKSINELLNEAEKNASTDKRKDFVVDINKVRLELSQDAAKDAAEQLKEDLQKAFDNVGKEWNIYKSLIDAGMKYSDAASFAFNDSGKTFANQSEYLRKIMQGQFKDASGNAIGFDLTEAEAAQRMGGKGSEMYNRMFETWKQVKSAIESDELQLKIDAAKIVAEYGSIQDKIEALNDKYVPLTGGSIVNGAIGEGTVGDSKEQQAAFMKYSEELAKLRGESLKLLPVWKELFGDMTYRSYGQLMKAVDKAKQIKDNASIQRGKDGRPSTFTSFFTDDNGDKVEISDTYNTLESIIKAIDTLMEKGDKKNPFAALGRSLKEIFSGKVEGEDKAVAMRRIAGEASLCAGECSDFAKSLSSMFDALGNDKLSRVASDAEDAFDSVKNIASGAASGGWIGAIVAAAGEAVKWVCKIANAHDEQLNRSIARSEERVKKLKAEYSRLQKTMERALGTGISSDIIKARDSLIKEQKELWQQIVDEQSKKNVDESKITDLRSQIAELNDQVKYFYEDLAGDNYNADIKNWASQISDALVDAFATGEDAAKAFDDVVADIMKDVVKQMVNMNVIQPAMYNLRSKLFGDNGLFAFGSENDEELTANEAAELATEMMKLKSQIERAQQIYGQVNDAAKEVGIDMAKSASGSLSSGIKSVTESTADLLASYINGIRADVSMNRESVRALVEDAMPQMSIIAQAQLQHLAVIADNTGRNAEFAEDIRDLLHRNINGGNKFSIQ